MFAIALLSVSAQLSLHSKQKTVQLDSVKIVATLARSRRHVSTAGQSGANWLHRVGSVRRWLTLASVYTAERYGSRRARAMRPRGGE